MAAQPIETLHPQAVSRDLALDIARTHLEVWPSRKWSTVEFAEFLLAKSVRPGEPPEQASRFHLIRENGRVLAFARSFGRDVATRAGSLTVMALAGVFSAPDRRGENLGKRIVEATLQRVHDGTFSFSLFQTTAKVQPFYEKLGAVVAKNRFVNSRAEDPKASPWFDEVVMRYPNGPGWPEGEIDLLGPGY